MQHQYMAVSLLSARAEVRVPGACKMAAEDLMLERQQVEVYTALIREIGDRDIVTRQLLIGILAETEQHASELADYLKRTADAK
jgi:bacterioferritin (cytochrome b1)